MRCLLLLLGVLCALLPARGAKPPTWSARTLYAWFDTLELPPLGEARFVRIYSRYVPASKEESGRRTRVSEGFILEETPTSFRAELADLTTSVFDKVTRQGDGTSYCEYEEISLSEEVARWATEVSRNPHYFADWARQNDVYFDRLSRHAQMFVFARECSRRGAPAVAEKLVKALATHRIDDGDNRRDVFPEWLKSDLAEAMYWRVHVAFRDPAKSWSDLLAEYSRLAELFPDAYETRELSPVAAIAALVSEEAEHRRFTPESLGELSPAEQAREWVWRLRDEQDPTSDEADAWPLPWDRPKRESNGAMRALVALGFAAVPELLAELRRPERLSRSIARSSRYGGGIWTQKTQTLAVTVLNQIAGLSMYDLTPPAKTPDQLMPHVLASAEAWWEGIGEQGERAWLIEHVRAGGRAGLACAKRLRERFPEAFVDAAGAGIKASVDPQDPYPREQLINALATSQDPAVDEVLREEMYHGPSFGSRVLAAHWRRHRGSADADAGMLAEWRSFMAQPGEQKFTGEECGPPGTQGTAIFVGSPFSHGADRLLEFLAGSGKAETLSALLEAWPALPFDWRALLVERLSGRSLDEATDTDEKPDRPAQRAMQEILLAALEETREQNGSYSSSEGTVANPRLCDLAAAALAQHWPHEFRFDRFAPESQRERQRVAILNPRRESLGQAPLPLPPVRPQVAAGKENAVAAIEWQPGSIKPRTLLAERVAGLRGHAADAGAFAEILAGYSARPQPGTAGLQLVISRDGDGTGVIVQARLWAGETAGARSRGAQELVTSGREMVYNSAGRGDRESRSRAKDWGFVRPAADVLDSPPERPIFIKVALRVER